MIQISHLSKVYNPKSESPVKALDDVGLSVKAGEMIAIVGRSGAGKSTLLHMIGCLDRPTSAEYLLDGTDIAKKSSKELSRIRNQKFGFVMQSFALIGDETALHNVSIPLMFSKTPFADIAGLALRSLKGLGVENLTHRIVSTMSGGEKQRVAIARALINNPDVILADEPTGALDTKNSVMIMGIFEKLNQIGKTVIIVTHEPSVAERCKRVVTMADGKIVNDDNTAC